MIKKVLSSGLCLLIALQLLPILSANDIILNNEITEDINTYGKGFRYNIQGWVYLHIEGEPYERGYQYGYLAPYEIIDMMQRWANLGHNYGFMKLYIQKNKPGNYDQLSEKWWEICKEQSVRKFLKQVPEEYQQEMQGMTDGLKERGVKLFGKEIEFEDVVAHQFVQDVLYTIKKAHKGIHPIRGFFNGFKDLLTGDILKYDGHCHVFIATGDATNDGGIVAAHETVFSPYIAQRCNFIVDVQPTKGNRFLMTSPAGSLWSQEDWYQNDKGIILTETELTPQGPWKVKGNMPKGVRSRIAIQYSDNIDEVIEKLKHGNNGLIPNEWIIGDTKTGEIASYMQALYNTPIKRTFNGYYQSNCFPQHIDVLSELTNLPKFMLKMYSKIFSKNALFSIEDDQVIWNQDVFQKQKELGAKYYGEIDEHIAKEIMSTYPITKGTTDCKLTTSDLMENLGAILYMGVPNGTTLTPTQEQKEKLKGFTDLPANGWVKIYPTDINKDELLKIQNIKFNIEKNTRWKLKPKLKDREIDETIFEDVSDEKLIVVNEGGLSILNKENGQIIWEEKIGKIIGKPVITNNKLIVGCLDGDAFIFDIDTGKEIWHHEFSFTPYLSELKQNNICVGSGETIYRYDINNGEKIWGFKTNGVITSKPTINDDVVYTGSWDGNLYSIDFKNGEEKWNFKTGWGVNTKPAIENNLVYFGSNDNNFYALNEKNGEMEWHFSCKAAIQSSPIVYGDYVFFGCDDGRFYALDKITGEGIWNYAPENYIKDNVYNYLTTPIISDSVVENGVVYFEAGDNVYALDTQTVEKQDIEKQESDENENYVIILLIIAFLIILFLVVMNYKINKN